MVPWKQFVGKQVVFLSVLAHASRHGQGPSTFILAVEFHDIALIALPSVVVGELYTENVTNQVPTYTA